MKLLKFNEMYKGEMGKNPARRIRLTDFMGNKFYIIEDNREINYRIANLRTPFTQDEVEMVIEDFKVIADINDLKLTNKLHNYVDLDPDLYYYQIHLFFDYYDYKDYVICIELNSQIDEDYINNILIDEEFQSDLNTFINQQINMGFRVEFDDDSIFILKNKPKMKYLESFKTIQENGSEEPEEPDFNEVSIELTDLKGNKFELRSDKTLFNQDEVEMILEDFEVIPKLHNINLHSENHEYLYEDSDFYQFYRVCFATSLDHLWGEQYILFELYLDELPNDVEEDLYSFINKIKNYGFKTIYNRKECNENGDKYSYIDITIEKI